jgi:protein ImuB
LEANVAVAANADAAMHAARGFPGVTVIPQGKEAERMGDLPVDVLLAGFRIEESGVGSQRKNGAHADQERALEILETLDRWGVRNFRTLAALPEVALSERLGQEGLRLQRMARGATQRALILAEPALSFEEAAELEYPVALLEPLAFILNRLLEQLCARLSARALATNELRLRLQLDPCGSEDMLGSPQRHRDTETIDDFKINDCRLKNQNPTSSPRINADERGSGPIRQSFYARALHLPVPMLNSKTFLKLLQLELQAHPPGAPVGTIWLAAEPVRSRAAQTGLFLPLSPEAEKLELTLARLAGVVGEGRAGSPEILDTHCPEKFRLRHFAPAVPKHDRQWPGTPAPLTALRLFRPPLRASVLLHGGAPVRITSAIQPEVRGEIVWSAGP